MKRIVFVPKAKCRACEFNDYKNTGVDYCIRAGCKYKVTESQEGGQYEYKKGQKHRFVT